MTGSYAVEDTLGAGGIATVYLVRHRKLGSLHAMKLISSTSAETNARLVLEGKLQAQLHHPNIVRVTDMVEVEGRPGLVMEFVDGPTLAQLLEQHTLSVPEIEDLGDGFLDGLSAAHDAGFIHRDLKPGNVLIAVYDNRLVPKIADFGLARALDQQHMDRLGHGVHTPAGRMMGTLRYMAPEQFLGSDVDHRADVWAAGCVLYELATGVSPFQCSSLDQCVRVITAGACPSPDALRPDLPTHLVEAIQSALTVDREARCPSARHLLEMWRGRVGAAGESGRYRREMIDALKVERPTSQGSTTAGGPTVSTDTWLPSTARGELSPEALIISLDGPAADVPGSAPRSRGSAAVVLGLLGAAVVLGVALTAFDRMQPAGPVQGDHAPSGPTVVLPPVAPPSEPAPAPTPQPVQVDPVPVTPAPKASPAPRPQPQPEPEPEPETGPGTDEPEQPAPVAVVVGPTHEVMLASVPQDARIWVDGVELPNTAPQRVPLTHRTHVVRMVMDGNHASIEKTIEVGDGLPDVFTWRVTSNEWSAQD